MHREALLFKIHVCIPDYIKFSLTSKCFGMNFLIVKNVHCMRHFRHLSFQNNQSDIDLSCKTDLDLIFSGEKALSHT